LGAAVTEKGSNDMTSVTLEETRERGWTPIGAVLRPYAVSRTMRRPAPPPSLDGEDDRWYLAYD